MSLRPPDSAAMRFRTRLIVKFLRPRRRLARGHGHNHPLQRSIIASMGTLHISDADLARDPYAVLAKVEEGMEVIVERDHRPVAKISPPKRSGRPISECIASARASGSKLILDSGFGDDVEEGIRERRQ